MDYGGTKHTGVPVKTLKKILKKAGLKVSGKKATLTRRAKKARLMKGGLFGFSSGTTPNPNPTTTNLRPDDRSKMSSILAPGAADKLNAEVAEKNTKAMAERIYKAAIADLPTQPSEHGYKLSMNLKEFIKKHDLLIPEPQTKDEEVLKNYAKAQKQLADAFQYMLNNTDYLSKQDLQNQANSSAYWIAKNKAEGYTGEKSKIYLFFRNLFKGY